MVSGKDRKEIRRSCKAGTNKYVVAKSYGIDISTVYRICNEKPKKIKKVKTEHNNSGLRTLIFKDAFVERMKRRAKN